MYMCLNGVMLRRELALEKASSAMYVCVAERGGTDQRASVEEGLVAGGARAAQRPLAVPQLVARQCFSRVCAEAAARDTALILQLAAVPLQVTLVLLVDFHMALQDAAFLEAVGRQRVALIAMPHL
ncbi:hypothetical protein ACJJTC_000375 [Scirpophaga incertulas]